MDTQDIPTIRDQFAERLGETDLKPRLEIQRIILLLGLDFCQQVADEAERIESEGGMMLPDDSRPRTLGGIFFLLVRQNVDNKTRRKIFFKPIRKVDYSLSGISPEEIKLAAPIPYQPAVPELPPFNWEERLFVLHELLHEKGQAKAPALPKPVSAGVLRELLREKGQAKTVKITLIGRPGRIVERQNLVITTVSSALKGPFPKGLPVPPETTTDYIVYIGAKQWNKVAHVVTAPEDVLIIEGECTYDADLPGMAVFATNVTTKRLQHAKQQSRQAKTAPASASPSSTVNQATPPSTDAVPPEAVKRLSQLRKAEMEARERMEELKSLPPEEQAGLSQALREVQQAKEAIKALLQQYPKLTSR